MNNLGPANSFLTHMHGGCACKDFSVEQVAAYVSLFQNELDADGRLNGLPDISVADRDAHVELFRKAIVSGGTPCQLRIPFNEAVRELAMVQWDAISRAAAV